MCVREREKGGTERGREGGEKAREREGEKRVYVYVNSFVLVLCGSVSVNRSPSGETACLN